MKTATVPYYRFGPPIRAARHKLGISCEALAREVGISLTSMGCVERGEQVPTIATLTAIARALGVEVAWLLDAARQADAPSEPVS